MSRREESLQPVAKEIESLGGQALSVPADTGTQLTSLVAGAQNLFFAPLHASRSSLVLPTAC